mmetsp:Transcript_45960/g.106130  ORF Transcript_45960/g.106130 Transcript_45960/m.106130 type:complete len:674 (+) Transcript_45960:159-2180(+)
MRMPALFDGQRYPTWWETAVSAVTGIALMWIGGEALLAVLQGLFVGVLGIVAFKFTQHRQQFMLAFSRRLSPLHQKTLSPPSTLSPASAEKEAEKTQRMDASEISARSARSREALPLAAQAAAPPSSPAPSVAVAPALPAHSTRLPSAADMQAFGEALGALRFRAEHKSQARETPGRVAAAVSNGAALELLNKASSHVEDDPWKHPLLGPQSRIQIAEPSGPRAAELKRGILRLLNRACPENVGTIVEQLADIKLNSSGELGFVIKTLFKRALADPHYCETYADLAFGLYTVSSEPPTGAGDGAVSVSFASLVVTVCHSEFEALRTSFKDTTDSAGADPEEIEFELKKRKEQMLAMMSLMGNLFLRGLVTSCMIGAVLADLIGEQEEGPLPAERDVECACEVLRSVGATLQADLASEPIVTKFFRRLIDLRSAKSASGKDAYCKRLQFAVQDLVDLRGAGWVKKVFKSSAKTKDEIRCEAANEEELKHQGEDGVQVAVAGQRPQTIAGVKVKWGEEDGVGQASPKEQSPSAVTSPSVATQGTKDWPKSYDRTSVVVQLPWGLAGKVIGPRGETARVLQEETGTRVWVDRQASQARISGAPEAVAVAERAITALVAVGGVEGLASGDDETCTSSTRSSSSLTESESSEWSRSRSEKSWHSHDPNRTGARKKSAR